MEKVIKGLQTHADGCGYRSHHCDAMECPYRYGDESCDIEEMCRDALALLKEQERLLRKLQNDKDKLCLEVSEWKHKFHDRQIKEQETANLYKCPNCGTWVSAENVVRCKDCKYWNNKSTCEYRVCKKHTNGISIINFATHGNWFCADGERR